MNERQDLKQKEDQQVSAPQQSERSMRPAVDIFEDKGGITLHADPAFPGNGWTYRSRAIP